MEENFGISGEGNAVAEKILVQIVGADYVETDEGGCASWQAGDASAGNEADDVRALNLLCTGYIVVDPCHELLGKCMHLFLHVY